MKKLKIDYITFLNIILLTACAITLIIVGSVDTSIPNAKEIYVDEPTTELVIEHKFAEVEITSVDICGMVDYSVDTASLYDAEASDISKEPLECFAPDETYEYVPAADPSNISTEPVPVNTVSSAPGSRSLGYFTITAYCACSQCCGAYAENRGDVVTGALGVPLIPNYSIAVDPNVIGFYDVVYINGQAYEAHDTGGAIKGNRIDIYMDDHQAALNWGAQYVEVFY